MEQSAVEWLINELKKRGQHHILGIYENIFHSAKAMEKNQIELMQNEKEKLLQEIENLKMMSNDN